MTHFVQIFVYHWLPMSANMLLASDNFVEGSIERGIRRSGSFEGPPQVHRDALSFEHLIKLRPIDTDSQSVKIWGKINVRGFVQHALRIQIPPGSEATWLGRNIPLLTEQLAERLIEIAPYTVKNNLAVMHERILNYEHFSSLLHRLDAAIDNSAANFLKSHRIVLVCLTPEQREGLNDQAIPTMQFDTAFEAASDRPVAVVSNDQPWYSNIIFSADKYSKDELAQFDGILYKYGAFIALSNSATIVMDIIRTTQAFIPPLRRELALALQFGTALEEDFTPFARISRYLGYVNIKLPVLLAISTHARTTYASPEFEAKRKFFEMREEVEKYVTLSSVPNGVRNTDDLPNRLFETVKQLETLGKEGRSEFGVFSEELSRVLNITLASERARMSIRELTSAESSRELNRGGKNRANALQGLSIVLAGSLAISIATILHGLRESLGIELPETVAVFLTLVFMFAVILLAWWFINWTINEKSAHFRIEMDLKSRFNQDALIKFVSTQPLKRTDINHGRRIQTWATKIDCYTAPLTPFRWLSRQRHSFEVTIDYYVNGFIHAITIESEYRNVKFDELGLVTSVFDQFQSAGCMPFPDPDDDRTLVFADILLQLRIDLDKDLFALSYLLSLSNKELEDRISIWMLDDRTLPDIELQYLDDLLKTKERRQQYIDWLFAVPKPQVMLLGRSNIESKRRILESYNGEGSQ